MEQHSQFVFFLSFQLLLVFLLPISGHAQLLPVVEEHEADMQTYIIDVERHDRHELLEDEDLKSWHVSFLPNSTLDSGAPRLIYSYRHVLSGFAARLTISELETVKSKPSFLYAQLETRHNVETTYTPRYLGVTSNNGWGSTMMGKGVIIGIIDTGIKPDHPSFNDSNMPTPPPASTLNGNCSYKGFSCNKKVIGAKAFKGATHPSPLDTEGHGTHVASIAAGSFVTDANVLEMANGMSSGMAPLAYLSIYKVCFNGCDDSDIYAGIDQAIKDGVDIISMSISGGQTDTLYEDTVSRGSMAAVQHGIVAVSSAGNKGPDPATLSHSAPWVLVVGAIAADRRIESIVELGNGRTFLGESAYQPHNWDSNTQFPLDYPGKNGDSKAHHCFPSALAKLNITGKIIICVVGGNVDSVDKGIAAYKAGAKGMIMMNQIARGYTTYSEAHHLPASHIFYAARKEIMAYYSKTKTKATAAIRFNNTKFGFRPSPAVTSFSSRGPSMMNGGVIKPDVLAPGSNILGAWPKGVGLNPDPLATHTFNFASGTSMAAPHVSGTVALFRAKHRGWTPSEILSAIVTTANDLSTAGTPGSAIVDQFSNNPAGIYTTGAGELSPIKAMDPGLVFGLTSNDYLGYLCGLGYTDGEVTLTMGKMMNCTGVKKLSATELNYPSIAVNLTQFTKIQKVSRTAKNVGNPREVYKALITPPTGVKIDLSPSTLNYTSINEEKSYEIKFEMVGSYPSKGSDMIRRGKIVWDSGKHVVTTPIAIRFV